MKNKKGVLLEFCDLVLNRYGEYDTSYFVVRMIANRTFGCLFYVCNNELYYCMEQIREKYSKIELNANELMNYTIVWSKLEKNILKLN